MLPDEAGAAAVPSQRFSHRASPRGHMHCSSYKGPNMTRELAAPILSFVLQTQMATKRLPWSFFRTKPLKRTPRLASTRRSSAKRAIF